MSTEIKTSTGTHPVDPYKARGFQQPILEEKIQDLVHFINDLKYGMLTTKLSSDSDLLTSRCMAIAGTENGGVDLIFHTNLFSGKTMDLSVHPTETNMSFLDPVSGSWASISGTASIIANQEAIQKYYSPGLRTWLGDLGDGVHDGGPSDPRIGLIKLEAKLSTYMLSKHGIVGRMTETVKSAAQGKVPDITSIRELSEEELEKWRRTHKD